MLSASWGRTSTTTGEFPIGAISAPPSRPVTSTHPSLRVLRLPRLHQRDLLVLGRDDVLRQFLHLRILAVSQFHLSHVHGTLMMRDHAIDEVLVGIAGVRH